MNEQKTGPLIIAFVSDLMFQTRILTVAQFLEYRIEWIESAESLGGSAQREGPGEALDGAAGALSRKVTKEQPALLVFDLNNNTIPWKNWIARLKSSPATRRFPVLAYGSHVDTESLKAAHAAGADQVVARSRFVDAMPELFKTMALVPDYAEAHAACAEPLSDLAREGIALFNKGEFYESHELLEDAWNDDPSAGRELYRAILQIAVAYMQIERGNYRGAVKMFLRVRQWLAPYPAVCRTVDLDTLRADSEAVYQALEAAGPDGLADFDRTLFRPIQLIGT